MTIRSMKPAQSLEFWKTFLQVYQDLFQLNFQILRTSINLLRVCLGSVINYYSSSTIADDFCLNKTSENKVLQIIKKIEIFKAAGRDKLSGRFLWDAVAILTRPMCEICNLSISREVFPDTCKIPKLKPIYKKRRTLPTTDLFVYSQSFIRRLKR